MSLGKTKLIETTKLRFFLTYQVLCAPISSLCAGSSALVLCNGSVRRRVDFATQKIHEQPTSYRCRALSSALERIRPKQAL